MYLSGVGVTRKSLYLGFKFGACIQGKVRSKRG